MDWDKVIRLCKRNGYCTEGHIALWTGKMGITAYLAFRQLKLMCREGLLDDEDEGLRCVPSKGKIMFVRVGRE